MGHFLVIFGGFMGVFLAKWVIQPVLSYFLLPLAKTLVLAMIEAYRTSESIKKERDEAVKKLKMIKDAKEAGDENAYNSAIDNI